MKKFVFLCAFMAVIMSACGISDESKMTTLESTSVKSTTTAAETTTTKSTTQETSLTTAATTTEATASVTTTVQTTTATVATTAVTTAAPKLTTAAITTVTTSPKVTTPVTTTFPVTTIPITATAVTTTAPIVPTIPADLKDFADEIFRLTNVERVKAGLPKLERFTLLDNAAQCRAVECATNQTLSHTRPDGREFKTVLEDFGLIKQCSWWSENVGACSVKPTAQFAVDQWMNSQGHKENLLRDKHTHVGIGVAVGKNGWYYYTQAYIQLKK